MIYFHLYILFVDNHIEHHFIKRFSDLSQTKSKFYYYEEVDHKYGKGKCIKREDITCFEILPYRSPEYDKEIDKQKDF